MKKILAILLLITTCGFSQSSKHTIPLTRNGQSLVQGTGQVIPAVRLLATDGTLPAANVTGLSTAIGSNTNVTSRVANTTQIKINNTTLTLNTPLLDFGTIAGGSFSGGTVANDIEFSSTGVGPVMPAADGSRWRLSIEPTGAISATKLSN